MQFRKFFLEQATSTNKILVQQLQSKDLPEGFVLYTTHQTQGYGQQQTTWCCQRGKDLAMSIVLKPTFLAAHQLFLLSMTVALGVQKAVVECIKRKHVVYLKWPNDVLIGCRKVAGILIENQWERTLLKNAVVGIGININSETFPKVIQKSAISLFQVCGQVFSVEEVLEQVLSAIAEYYQLLHEGAYERIVHLYHERLLGWQRVVGVLRGRELYRAILKEVDEEGALNLVPLHQIKQVQRFYAKEVQLFYSFP